MNGFCFTGKAFENIPFALHDSIYGDNFTIEGDAVEKIGNNVSITFRGINFKDAATHIELSYRSRLDSNTIRIVFVCEDGQEVINTITLPSQENYVAVSPKANCEAAGDCIKLDTALCGNGTVSFIFLPGSDIDLEWFKFHRR